MKQAKLQLLLSSAVLAIMLITAIASMEAGSFSDFTAVVWNTRSRTTILQPLQT